ncbi:MAG: prolyl oligopeptidase family serine peptidase [Phycisphaerae bacterium]|jgi:dienelactone hydrolase
MSMNRRKRAATSTISVAGKYLAWTLLVGAWPQPLAQSQPATSSRPSTLLIRDWLVLDSVGKYGRAPLHIDPIQAEIAAGRWRAPHAGETVVAADGASKKWRSAQAGDDGWLRDEKLAGGYAFAALESPTPRVALLQASGHSMIYVNGAPRAGDPYQNGLLVVPVELKKGANTLLAPCGRGALRVELGEPLAERQFARVDHTLPDLIAGEPVDTWAAVPVLNAAATPAVGLEIEAAIAGQPPLRTPVPTLIPLATRKCPIALRAEPPAEAGDASLTLRLIDKPNGNERELDRLDLRLQVRAAMDRHVRTFVSGIDGSVQYYAVTPMQGTERMNDGPALLLSLHGAAVEATNQAAAYAPKDWGYVVAPTNRRPFGFDWEDWGRLDALEVLDLALERYGIDPRRVLLTGHSMGGHGTWHLGVTFPGRFAAIAPSAGWISFWSYAGATETADPTPVEQMLRRAANTSDALALLPNLAPLGVYVLHGDADDNVPVEQARQMRGKLAAFHADFAYYERPGAGHWWGNECVDWPPLLEFLRAHVRPAPAAVRRVDFRTVNPGVSASCDWVTVSAQQHSLAPSRVSISLDPAARTFTGVTENVAALHLSLIELSRPQIRVEQDKSIDTTPLPAAVPLHVVLDGQRLAELAWPADGVLRLVRDAAGWRAGDTPAGWKNPRRCGPFKDAFRNRFVLVYGTHGSPDENAWMLYRARFDAETFAYRGNGSVDIVADADFDPAREPDRNVILYGNADTNHAWTRLLPPAPIEVRRGQVRVGGQTFRGDDLACLFVYPRADRSAALVGAVGASGLTGLRVAHRLPVFLSGVAYPDWIVMGPEILSAGAKGVRGCGFFGADWLLSDADSVWQAVPGD